MIIDKGVDISIPYPLILSFCAGLILGLCFKHSEVLPASKLLIETSQTNHNLTELPQYFLEESSNAQAEALGLSEHKFSCNTLSALESLSKLHQRKVFLEEQNRKGEANRARIANLQRKYGQAAAAEQAMRSCVSATIPELLEIWDKGLAHNPKFGQKWWDDQTESRLPDSQISIQDLQETAERLEEMSDDNINQN